MLVIFIRLSKLHFIFCLVESSKPGVSVTTLVVDPTGGGEALKQDLAQLAQCAMPVELTSWVFNFVVYFCFDMSFSFHR